MSKTFQKQMTFKYESELRKLTEEILEGFYGQPKDVLRSFILNLLDVSKAKDQELEMFLHDLEEDSIPIGEKSLNRIKYSHEFSSMPEGLPDTCYTFIPCQKPGTRIGLIRKGHLGFFNTSVDSTTWMDQKAKQIVESLNNDMNLTKTQVECMETGSMFGWFCPGADPANYNKKGMFKYEV